MSCTSLPHITIADIPGLSALLGDITFTTPEVGLNLCCNFPILPAFPEVVPLGEIMAGLALLGTAGDAILDIISTITETLNALLDQLSFNCPVD